MDGMSRDKRNGQQQDSQWGNFRGEADNTDLTQPARARARANDTSASPLCNKNCKDFGKAPTKKEEQDF